MVPSRLDPKGRAVFKPLGQNQAELACLAVLYFWRPYKSRHSNFRVAYTVKTFSQSIRECETGSISKKSITLTLKDVESSLDRPTSHKVSKIVKMIYFKMSQRKWMMFLNQILRPLKIFARNINDKMFLGHLAKFRIGIAETKRSCRFSNSWELSECNAQLY